MWGIIVSILIGALAGSKLGLTVSDAWWGQLLVGTAGSVVLLFILSLFRRK